MAELHNGFCPTHGKRLFISRAIAKDAIRRMREKGLRPYRCTEVVGHWHVGHLPPAVRAGRLTVAEVYGGAR